MGEQCGTWQGGMGDEWREVEAESGAGHITHEVQKLQARQASKGPIIQAGQLVVLLLGLRKGVDGTRDEGEAAVSAARGRAGRGDEWRRSGSGEWGRVHHARAPANTGS
jgi:hypothetical protein